jgi:hypothetical protein
VELRTLVDLFVSSPGDCAAEREAVASAIHDLNLTARTLCGLEACLISSGDLYPGIADYTQQVINRQLPDYDIHVGLWRHRVGTPTPVAPSGTVEELRNALDRYQRTRRPWIMCYFQTDSAQNFTDVQDMIMDRGCYYHTYVDISELRRMFLDHLTEYLKSGYRRVGHSTTAAKADAPDPSIVSYVFKIQSPGAGERTQSVARAVVGVGRAPERNQLVVPAKRVHREQGLFVWQAGEALFVDLAGDALHLPCGAVSAVPITSRQIFLRMGDAVVLPDGTRVTLKAIID